MAGPPGRARRRRRVVTPDLFVRGLAIGFAVAFALGPIGLLVIRRTIDRGWAYGFVSGLGVATADASYAAIAAFGLTAVTELLVGIDRLLGIIGGAILVTMAARTLRMALTGAVARERVDAGGGTDSGASPVDPASGWAPDRILDDGGPDAHEPGHDPVLRCAVREHRRGHRRPRRRAPGRGGRVRGVGRLVGDAHGGRRRVPRPSHAARRARVQRRVRAGDRRRSGPSPSALGLAG